ncbi:MAG: Fic family protein [Flavobacteriales bacterium]
MKPPYEITPDILQLVSSISTTLGEIKSGLLVKPDPLLRKRTRIKTIHASLKIEGNTLTEEQVTAILEGKRVIGPAHDIREVQNAVLVYDAIRVFNFTSSRSFLRAHKQMMSGLVTHAGKYRNQGAAIVKGKQLEHVAPPYDMVPYLMQDLFDYVKLHNEIPLIKSCVFHYELEFIHPFSDGNGRMGRLWQHVMLVHENPVFEYLPLETLIAQSQNQYYKALAASDKLGQSHPFIVYILGVINTALQNLVNQTSGVAVTQHERIQHFISLGISPFTRKEYMRVFKTISTATASRDLKTGVNQGFFHAKGDKNKTVYKVKKDP